MQLIRLTGKPIALEVVVARKNMVALGIKINGQIGEICVLVSIKL
jgi:hypothetical protein